jgi:E-phenylitaconyl-CoA hydratase
MRDYLATRADLPTKALDIAGSNAPLALRAAKKRVPQGLDILLVHALDVDKYISDLWRDIEYRIEGRRAVQEKRRPNYKGKSLFPAKRGHLTRH